MKIINNFLKSSICIILTLTSFTLTAQLGSTGDTKVGQGETAASNFTMDARALERQIDEININTQSLREEPRKIFVFKQIIQRISLLNIQSESRRWDKDHFIQMNKSIAVLNDLYSQTVELQKTNPLSASQAEKDNAMEGIVKKALIEEKVIMGISRS